MNLITHDQVKDKIIKIREQNVILDSDIAYLYGVTTKRINEAVKRNPKKFPKGYLIHLTQNEWNYMRSQFATSLPSGGRTYSPTAFTERGLYMLATILNSPKAVETTITIIDTFAQIKDLIQGVYEVSNAKNDMQKIEIIDKSTDIIADLLDNELFVSQQETSLKLKLPFLEISKKVTKMKG